jgi:hypothetical protein
MSEFEEMVIKIKRDRLIRMAEAWVQRARWLELALADCVTPEALDRVDLIERASERAARAEFERAAVEVLSDMDWTQHLVGEQ